MDKLIEKVKQWAIDRGLDGGDPARQYMKIGEELGEVSAAYNKNQHEELIDGLGDAFVTLIIFCLQVGVEPADALSVAYEEIKDRDGEMVKGVFIKSEDLERG